MQLKQVCFSQFFQKEPLHVDMLTEKLITSLKLLEHIGSMPDRFVKVTEWNTYRWKRFRNKIIFSNYARKRLNTLKTGLLLEDTRHWENQLINGSGLIQESELITH